MTGTLEGGARRVLSAIALLRRHRGLTSATGLTLILVLAAGYLIVGTLNINPVSRHYRITVEFEQSGGLLPGQDVTLRGVPIGRIDSVEVSDGKVRAVAAVEAGTRIPAAARVRAAALSAAGEQYLDFLPDSDTGPFLTDGAVLPADRTTTPVPLSDVLEGLSGILLQMDPVQLTAIMNELGVSADGPDKLAAIIDGGIFLVSALDGVLPNTISLLRNSRTVLTTLGAGAATLRETGSDLAATLGGVGAMSDGFTEMLTRTPETLAAMDAIIAQNSPTMVQLLGNLATVAQMTHLRVPALQEFFFPQQRSGSALDAIASVFHDNAVWALASIYPRYQCDYDVPRRAGTVPDFPEPYLYSDCRNPDPTILPRGARNAPRPPGTDANILPPGADPHTTADPTPVGPQTIPTPFGGGRPPAYVPPN